MLTRPDPTTANPEFTGLSAAAAAARLAEEGFNELPGAAQRGALGVVLAIVTEPMFLLLLVCGVVYLVLGDTREALMLLGFVVVIITITSVQTRKSERALQALRDLAHPRALVMRDGMRTRIAGRDVVRDDVLIIAEGDRVPADACLLDGVNVLADESLLTGESVPVHKAPSLAPPSPAAPGGDHLPFLYSGSLIVQGQGIARVLATGPRTVLGQIGRVLAETPVEPTRIQRETNEVVKRLAWFGLTTSGAVALIYGLTRHDWLHGLLVGITLSMATLPEELPVVLTIFLALGAWRIAQQRVLTRRVPALETLGATTVLCVDKTGTLTRNEMARTARCSSWRGTAVPWRRTSTNCWSTPPSPAITIPSIRWSARSSRRLTASSATPSTCIATGRWSMSILFRSNC
jgi:Ca2+-transporting ATPase